MGKTTLINALLRDELLDARPTTMTTMVATILHYGMTRGVKVRFKVPESMAWNSQGWNGAAVVDEAEIAGFLPDGQADGAVASNGMGSRGDLCHARQ